jgi:mono/diheme cytochrome c family protein
MPGFKERLNDDEIWAVVAFMKSNWLEDPDLADQ